jgi:hypothetical protein
MSRRPVVALSRTVQVREISFSGRVDRPTDRAELLAVLTCVVEHGGRLSVAELSDHLLGGERLAIAERLLHICWEYGHLTPEDDDDDHWHLTSQAAEVLAEGVVLEPAWGVWRLAMASDPLLGDLLVEASAVEGDDLGTTVRGQTPQTSGTVDEQLKGRVDLLRGTSLGAVFGDLTSARVIRVDRYLRQTESTCDLELLVGEPEATPMLRRGREQRPFEVPSHPDLRAHAVDARERMLLAQGWDDEGGYLRVTADQLADTEVLRLERELPPSTVELGPHGSFTATTQGPLPVVPADASEAISIAIRRAALLLDDYATAARWAETVDRARQGLGTAATGAVLEREHALDCVEGKSGRSRPQRGWYLRAPLDWGL